MLKKSLLGLFILTSVQAWANQPPPNTLNMNYQNYPVLTAPSPVLQQGVNLGLQTPINPSVNTVVNQQISQYQQANLTPQQVADIKYAEALKNKMLASPYLSTPRPVIRSVMVNLAPDSTPPIMRMSLGMLSTLVFTDTDGQAWEIEQVQADSRLYRIHGSPTSNNADANANANRTMQEALSGEVVNNPQPQMQDTGYQRAKNMVMIEPLEAWSGSNIVVLLKGKQTPVIILVTTGQDEADLRLDMKVQGLNPDRKYNPLNMGASGVQNITGIDEDILGFLDGRIPDSAMSLLSSDGTATAWDVNGRTYVKSRLDVLHPAYSAKVSSNESTHVYRFDNLGQNRTITLLQRYGQPVTVSFDNSPYYQQ